MEALKKFLDYLASDEYAQLLLKQAEQYYSISPKIIVKDEF